MSSTPETGFVGSALRTVFPEPRESVRSADPTRVAHRNSATSSDPTAHRRFLKSRVYPHLPAKWLWRFLYTYFAKLGILDGLPGLQYSLLVSFYDFLIELKLAEQKRCRTMSKVMMDEPIAGNFADSTDAAVVGSIAQQRNTSPWTRNQKLGRALWMIAWTVLFRPSFHNWYAWRGMLLRLFGAKIGIDVRIRPTVSIEIPWNLVIGDYAAVGDHAILYSLGKIALGRMASVSQYAHLCAGTHDYTMPAFPLVCLPITIGDEAWIATDAFVGPGVTVGNRAIVAARATVVKDVPAGHIVAGNPAKFVKLRDDAGKPATADELVPPVPPPAGLGSVG
jgi:putative colanic acid biosynthesis acetyltransferase WcaF